MLSIRANYEFSHACCVFCSLLILMSLGCWRYKMVVANRYFLPFWMERGLDPGLSWHRLILPVLVNLSLMHFHNCIPQPLLMQNKITYILVRSARFLKNESQSFRIFIYFLYRSIASSSHYVHIHDKCSAEKGITYLLATHTHLLMQYWQYHVYPWKVYVPL